MIHVALAGGVSFIVQPPRGPFADADSPPNRAEHVAHDMSSPHGRAPDRSRRRGNDREVEFWPSCSIAPDLQIRAMPALSAPTRNVLACGLLLAASSVAAAQTGPSERWATDTIHSRALGQRTIYVATPEGYRGGRSSYPVVVALDADDASQFRLWIAEAAYLADNSPGLPPVIMVGIVNGNDRVHDMTPPAAGSTVKDYKTAGGAEAFATFILDEVLPHVRARYRTLPSAILAGH